MFVEFLGKEVKCCYNDRGQEKIARGRLMEIGKGLLRIKGDLGTLIIRDSMIQKMGLLRK